MARPFRLERLALDASAQISAFVKLKLRSCARPEPRAGFFAWFRDELKFPGSAEDKDTFRSLAPFAWLRVPSALIRQVCIVVYNTAGPGAMRFGVVVGLAASALRDRSAHGLEPGARSRIEERRQASGDAGVVAVATAERRPLWGHCGPKSSMRGRRRPRIAGSPMKWFSSPTKKCGRLRGRAGRARTRSGDGEGGRDRGRVAPMRALQREVAVATAGCGSPSAIQVLGSVCDWRLTKW